MKHIWSVLCGKSIIDSQKNNISLIDVLEQLNIKLPSEGIAQASEKGITIPISFDIVSLWMKDSEEKSEEVMVEIGMNDPENKELSSYNQSLRIPATHQRVRSVFHIERLSIFRPGVHKIRVKVKKKQDGREQIVAELPLDIRFTMEQKS